MNYAFASRPTFYNGVQFRSRLDAHWACFFDLVNWRWAYEPFDLIGWTPTFRVEFPCSHSECSGSHVLLVEVQPHFDITAFAGHRCMDFPYGECDQPTGEVESIPADASAAFGIGPDVTYWEMTHGAGGGVDCVNQWISADVNKLWNAAGNIIRGCQWVAHQERKSSHTLARAATVAPHSKLIAGRPEDASGGQLWPHGDSANMALDHAANHPLGGSSQKVPSTAGPWERPRYFTEFVSLVLA